MAKRIIKKIKVGVVGCGRISQKHFKAIKKNSKFLNLVAACDTNVRVLNKLKRDYKIKVYSNFDNMIKYDNTLSRIMNDDLALLNENTGYRNLPVNLVQGGITRRFGTNTTTYQSTDYQS